MGWYNVIHETTLFSLIGLICCVISFVWDLRNSMYFLTVITNKIKKIHNQINEERYAKKANITFFFFGISLYLLSISLTLSSKVTHLEPLIMFLSGFTCACGVVFISFSKRLSQLYLNSVNRR